MSAKGSSCCSAVLMAPNEPSMKGAGSGTGGAMNGREGGAAEVEAKAGSEEEDGRVSSSEDGLGGRAGETAVVVAATAAIALSHTSSSSSSSSSPCSTAAPAPPPATTYIVWVGEHRHEHPALSYMAPLKAFLMTE